MKVTNRLAYNSTKLNTTVKSFIAKVPGLLFLENEKNMDNNNVIIEKINH
jgi:hypothetical protein